MCNNKAHSYLCLQLSYFSLQTLKKYPNSSALNVAPIRDFVYHLTDNFFSSCPAHPNPLVRSIGNYTLADLHRQYKKNIHKRPKHLLL